MVGKICKFVVFNLLEHALVSQKKNESKYFYSCSHLAKLFPRSLLLPFPGREKLLIPPDCIFSDTCPPAAEKGIYGTVNLHNFKS